MFAQTVSRPCSVLTLGHHVCDIGVLFPTTTVQAGLPRSAFNQDAQAAHDLYLRLVGKMHWYKAEPGALDRACRDFDVLDDASIQRGEVRDGRLHIGEESYGAIVLRRARPGSGGRPSIRSPGGSIRIISIKEPWVPKGTSRKSF